MEFGQILVTIIIGFSICSVLFLMTYWVRPQLLSKLITVQVLDYQEVQEAENEFDKPYLLSQMNNNK